MESEEYMNRESRKQRGEAEVSILIITIIIIIIIVTVIVREYTQREGGVRGLTILTACDHHIVLPWDKYTGDAAMRR